MKKGAILVMLLLAGQARADLRTKAAQELAETLMSKFGAAAGRSLPALAQRIESYAARYGEEAMVALRKVGPSAFTLVEAAGKDGAKAIRVLAQHGEAGATRVLSRPQAMSQYLKYGDEAASVLVRHPGVAENLVERGGLPAIKALSTVTPQNGRRLAMLLENELAPQAAQHPAILDCVATHGSVAMDFIWEHKSALAVGTVLTTFLIHPEPFISGLKDISTVVGENAVKPLADIPGQAVKGIAAGTNWTVVILSLLGVIVCYVVIRRCVRQQVPPPLPETIRRL